MHASSSRFSALLSSIHPSHPAARILMLKTMKPATAMMVAALAGVFCIGLTTSCQAQAGPTDGGDGLFSFSIVGYSSEDLSSHESLLELFERWLSRHRKAYASVEEKLRRFEVFKDNLHHIDETNRRNVSSSYWLGLNEFADLTHDEFKATYLGLQGGPTSSSARGGKEEGGGDEDEDEDEDEYEYDDGQPIDTTEDDGAGSSLRLFRYAGVDASSLPKSVDWRKNGAVTGVKNQGQCGSCWAFSTVAAVEGINQIVTGNLTALSEQELIDCDTGGMNHGCNGGLMDYAFSYIARNGGLHTEEDYPYLMEEGTCQRGPGRRNKHSVAIAASDVDVVTISGYEDVPRNNEQALLKALAHQPVSVAIEASGRNLQFYKGGVFDGPCGTQLDHGVAAVGYGTAADKDGSGGHDSDYIIVKNSWGSSWGEKGYIRMRRGTGKRHGLCGIYKMASYPTKN